MTIANHTGATEQRPCSRCGAVVDHRETEVACGGKALWLAEKHDAPCGLPCMGGGVHPRHVRERGFGAHGFRDRCPKCGPLRVLPEVVAEMRERARRSQEPIVGVEAFSMIRGLGTDLLDALDEIDKLRAEFAQAREALGEAREQATWVQQELMDREVADEEKRHAEHRSPPVEWAWLDEKHRAELTRWVRQQVEEIQDNAKAWRLSGEVETALRYEDLAASLLALVALPEAQSPLTPEQREMLGRETMLVWWGRDLAGDGTPDFLAFRDDWERAGERLFLRGIGAGRDLLMAGQLLRRLLICDEIHRADREIPPGLQIAVGRIVGAVERLGDIPPDREPVRSVEPATDAEREEV